MKWHVSKVNHKTGPDGTFPIWPEYFALFLFFLVLLPLESVYAQVAVPTTIKEMPATTTTNTTINTVPGTDEYDCLKKAALLEEDGIKTLNKLIAAWKKFGELNRDRKNTNDILKEIRTLERRYFDEQEAYLDLQIECFQLSQPADDAGLQCYEKFEALTKNASLNFPSQYIDKNCEGIFVSDPKTKAVTLASYALAKPPFSVAAAKKGEKEKEKKERLELFETKKLQWYGMCLSAVSAEVVSCKVFDSVAQDTCYRRFSDASQSKTMQAFAKLIEDRKTVCERRKKIVVNVAEPLPPVVVHPGLQGGPARSTPNRNQGSGSRLGEPGSNGGPIPRHGNTF